MRKYEYLYIFDPQQESAEQAIELVKNKYNEIGASIVNENVMGKRKLAYEINKKSDGFYYITQIEIENYSALPDFEKEIKMNPSVLRVLKFRID